MYNLTFTVNGVAEAKYYTGGMRDAGTGVVANAQGPAGTDTFYRGGTPVAQEFYNVYKLVVRNPGGAELNHYYLNSFPQTTTPYEDHETFLLHYTKTIPVPGGGTVDLFMGDSNCHAVDNCGPGVYARRVHRQPQRAERADAEGADHVHGQAGLEHQPAQRRQSALPRPDHSHHGQFRRRDVSAAPTGSK